MEKNNRRINFRKTGNTNDMHGLGGFAVYNNSAVIIAGLNNTSGNTEIYNPTTRTWKTTSRGRIQIFVCNLNCI